VPPRRNTNPAPSLRTEAEAIQKKRANEEYEQLDCFVVPPRNDGKGCFVVPPRRITNPAPSLRTEGEAIQKKGANEEYEQLDCFVVPPRNDGNGRVKRWIASSCLLAMTERKTQSILLLCNEAKPSPSLRTEGEAIQKGVTRVGNIKAIFG